MNDDRLVCGVCGFASLNPKAVAHGIVHWADGRGRGGWDVAPRCTDHDACRGRLLEAGVPWPLVGGKTNATDKPATWRPRLTPGPSEHVPVPAGAVVVAAPADNPEEWW